MKNLKRIILIFFAFFSFFLIAAGFFAANSEAFDISSTKNAPESVILSLKNYENDIINSKDFESSFCAGLQSSSSVFKRRIQNTGFSGANSCASLFDKQFGGLLSYLYSKSYLDSKPKTGISLLLFQIHPNAPPEPSELSATALGDALALKLSSDKL